MKIKIATNAGVKEVDAQPAFTIFGHSFFVHNDVAEEHWGNVEYWCCTHLGTGRRLSSWYLSKDEAVKESMIRIQQIGEEEFIAGIQRARNENKKIGIKI